MGTNKEIVLGLYTAFSIEMSKTSRARRRGIPLDRLKLRVMAEYASSGIWIIEKLGYFRHGMIGYSSLKLSPELAIRFEQWIELYWGMLEDNLDIDEFNQVGRKLARELKTHIGQSGYVEFIPELATGGLGEREIIE
jgi:hypothetical protein